MALVPNLTVAENVMFNDTVMNMKGKLFMNYAKLRADAKEVLDQLHVSIDVNRICSTLSLAEKQLVLIARAIQNECNFLILDEPTAPLSDAETDELFRVVQHLCDTRNMAVIFITHRIHEVLRICDSYTVMRNGEVVDRSPITSETTSKEIVDKMLGRSFEENFPKEVCEIGEKSFIIENLTEKDGKVKDINMYVRKGEIVGLAGLVGGGKTELCKTIFGAYKKKSGTITLNGKELKIKKPTDAVKNRIALVPEERRKEGVLVAETCVFNLAAASLDTFCKLGFVDTVKTAKNAQHYVDDLGVKTPSIRQKVALLSGGNQQKVVVGKWLAADCDVYIFDEPTKGVDVGAKMEIFRLINQIAKEGNCVIYATCENSELLSITDRMYVMFDGKIMAELETAKTSEKEIMHYATGATEAYVEE
jgi:simple sugar transport system ATP-binding protein